MDRTHHLEQGKNKNQEFIQKIKDDRLSIALYVGQPMFKGEGYVKQLPDPPRNTEEFLRAKENVRIILYSLVISLVIKGNTEKALDYFKFLAKLDPTGHYNHFLWLGLLYLKSGNKKLAKKNLEQALWICKEDKIWPIVSKESIDKISKNIENLIELCK